jgi:hypothetical protein
LQAKNLIEVIVIKEGFANNNGVKIHYPADIVRALTVVTGLIVYVVTR